MKTYTLTESLALLPPSELIGFMRTHGLDEGGNTVVGELPRKEVLDLINNTGHQLFQSGPKTLAKGYGLAMQDEHGWIFFRTI